MSRIAHLEALLPALPNAVAKTKFGDNLRSIAQDIRDAATLSKDAKALLQIAIEIDLIDIPSRRQRIEEMFDASGVAARQFENAKDDSALRTAKDDYNEWKKSVRSLGLAVSEHWEGVRSRQFDPLAAYGEILGLVPGLAPLAQQFVACSRQAKAISMSSGAVSMLEKITSAKATLRTLQEQRAQQVQDPAVGHFLNAVADRKATLEDVNDDVLRWLRENGGAKRFQLTPIGS